MTTDDAVRILHRYQRWRKGNGEKDFEAADLDVKEISEALDKLLNEVTVLKRTLSSVTSQLAKCQVQREMLHSELRGVKRSG